jgi:hypothetical protein
MLRLQKGQSQKVKNDGRPTYLSLLINFVLIKDCSIFGCYRDFRSIKLSILLVLDRLNISSLGWVRGWDGVRLGEGIESGSGSRYKLG